MDKQTEDYLLILVTTWYNIMPMLVPDLEINKAKEILFFAVKNMMKNKGKNVSLDEVSTMFDKVNKTISYIKLKDAAALIKQITEDLESGK